MTTMQAIYLAVRDANPEKYENHWEDVATKVGMDPNDKAFEQLVKAMKVSGYLRTRDEAFFIGPTPLPDASGGGVIPARRPRPGVKPATKDQLGVAKRVELWDDETLVGSGYVREPREEGSVCVAGVTKAGDPTVRIGVQPENRSDWKAAEDDGYTVTLDPEGVAALERGIEQIIADGEGSAGPYRAAEKRLDTALDRLHDVEAPHVGAQAAEDAFYAELNQESDRRLREMWRERDDIERYANALGPDERAEYDDQQARYETFTDQGGSEGHVRASGDERRDARARQMVIMHPQITLAEAEEFLRIHETPWRSRPSTMNQREKELLAKTGIGSLYRIDGEDSWLAGMLSQYGKDRDIDEKQALIERVRAGAKPVSAEQQAEIDAAWAEIRAAQKEYDALAGADISRIVVPGTNGRDIVLDVAQGEEGDPHRYRVDSCAAGAGGKDWSPAGDPWVPTPAEMRKLAKLTRQQLGAATPEGWRPPPSGVPEV